MTGSGALRRDLGRRLAAARRAAGYTQQRLATATGYSRSTVSNAEIGHPDVARVFWIRCDEILRTGRAFELDFEQVRAAERDLAGEPGAAAAAGEPAAGGRALAGGTAEALAGYRDLGWPAVGHDDLVELITGEVLDALELPRAAGLLAAALWLYSRGRADDARRLPALPHPARSLAVITAGERCFVLAAPGGCPWTGQQPAPDGGPDGSLVGRVIRWHAGGSRIPAPPSRLPAGGQAAWAHLPARPVQLAPPVALLGLLATAAAGVSGGPAGFTLPGGIRVLPPPGPPTGELNTCQLCCRPAGHLLPGKCQAPAPGVRPRQFPRPGRSRRGPACRFTIANGLARHALRRISHGPLARPAPGVPASNARNVPGHSRLRG